MRFWRLSGISDTRQNRKEPLKSINSKRSCYISVYLICVTKVISLSAENEYNRRYNADISLSAVRTHSFSAFVYHHSTLARA